ncbi:alpha/beta hydrolase [Streptomyces sp. 4N509B]|uniref:alpha/beta hydrolase n=1 Tax=Streptomyces sp. 4N509B TaxID=3457413 RepID=UPI003FD617AC
MTTATTLARIPRPVLVLPASLAALALLASGAACSGDAGGDGGGRLRTAGAGGIAGPAEPVATADSADADAVDTQDLPDALTGQSLDWSACHVLDSRQGDDETSPEPLPDDGDDNDGSANGDGNGNGSADRDDGGTPWECARLTVPLDYADPRGDTIEIALIRAPARERGEERVGSLLFNFGGPGGSGVAALPAFAGDYEELHEHYDLVSFDPRGVGASQGVVCLDDRELDAYFAADPVPATSAERAKLTDRLQGFADACSDRAGALLPHLTTANTARDMDLLRHVLGDDELHYFGVSYGTQLGGVYAHLFPQRVGRAVLDAVVDPTLTPEESARGQAAGFQQALAAYVEACAADDDTGDGNAGGGAGCPLGDTEKQANQRLNDLLDDLREDPMPTRDPDGRRLTRSLAVSGIAQALYSQDFWSFLTQGLDDALPAEGQDPDGTVLLALGDALNGRNPDGTYTTLQSSLTAISCADSRQRYDVADVRAALDSFRAASPVFGESLAWGMLNCAYWPVRGTDRQPPVAADGAPPILLVGTTGDPATPYAGTRRMREALGDDVGVVLTYEGEGHGAYTGGNACVRDTIDAYLVDGHVPRDGKVCDD